MRWARTTRSDPAVCALADRHYPRRRLGAKTVGGSGRLLVLRTLAGDAAWVSTWPLYPLHAFGDAWTNSTFRNEGGALSSELILEALAATRARWGDPPAAGTITFVDPAAIASSNPGYCYKVAGFKRIARTRGRHKGRPDLDVLQLLPELHPAPAPALELQLAFA